MCDKKAQVEPLPLVPPTVITGQEGARSIAFFTWVTRVKPMSMVVGWAVSKWASHWESVLLCIFYRLLMVIESCVSLNGRMPGLCFQAAEIDFRLPKQCFQAA